SQQKSLTSAPGDSTVPLWNIGTQDDSGADLALGPSDYKKFLSMDFGYEDRYYLIGHSKASDDFPYVLPGPDDAWGGTSGTAGLRTHEANILFGVDSLPAHGDWFLVVDLVDSNPSKSLLKVSVNIQHEKFLLKGVSDSSIVQAPDTKAGRVLRIPLNKKTIHSGGNKVTLTVLEGSWVV